MKLVPKWNAAEEGTVGLIEPAAEDVNALVNPPLANAKRCKEASRKLRECAFAIGR